MLEHRMTLVRFRLFRKNLGNLREFFGQMVHRPPSPPWQKIARAPMALRIRLQHREYLIGVKPICVDERLPSDVNLRYWYSTDGSK